MGVGAGVKVGGYVDGWEQGFIPTAKQADRMMHAFRQANQTRVFHQTTTAVRNVCQDGIGRAICTCLYIKKTRL